jgi:GT2 family glycosyltransferase
VRKAPRLGNDLLGLTGLTLLAGTSRTNRALHDREEDEIEGTGFLSGACFLARTAALKEVGGFDPEFFLYYEDADLFRRLRAAGWELWVSWPTRVRHAHGGSWKDPVRRQIEGFRGALTFHRKHGGPLAAAVYRLGLLSIYLPRMLLGGILSSMRWMKSSFDLRQRFRLVSATVRIALGVPPRPERRRPPERTTEPIRGRRA